MSAATRPGIAPVGWSIALHAAIAGFMYLGLSLPRPEAPEMPLMIEAGLTPLEVLRSATVNGALLLGLSGKAGVIAEGALADLVVLDADPLADIGNLAKVHRVLKDGVVYDPEELMRSIR